jgi:hypothetical protein
VVESVPPVTSVDDVTSAAWMGALGDDPAPVAAHAAPPETSATVVAETRLTMRRRTSTEYPPGLNGQHQVSAAGREFLESCPDFSACECTMRVLGTRVYRWRRNNSAQQRARTYGRQSAPQRRSGRSRTCRRRRVRHWANRARRSPAAGVREARSQRPAPSSTSKRSGATSRVVRRWVEASWSARCGNSIRHT